MTDTAVAQEPTKKRRYQRGIPVDEREQMFVNEYMVDFVATRAYLAIGYSATGASQAASKMLMRPSVQEKLRVAMSNLMKKHDVRLDDVIMEIKSIGFANMIDYTGVDGDGRPYLDFTRVMNDRVKWAAVQEITVDEYTEGRGDETRNVKRTKFKLHDKLGALDKLLRYLGGYNGKEAPTINDNRTQVLNVHVTPEEAAKQYQKFLAAPVIEATRTDTAR